MNYLKLNTLVPTSLPEIRAANPQVSIPDGADISDLGYEPLQATEAPTPPEWHLVETAPPEQVEGTWRTTWLVREMSPSEKSAHAAARIRQIEEETGVVRILRDATILQLETWATAQGHPLPAFRAANKGYRLLKETDEFIISLRAYITP